MDGEFMGYTEGTLLRTIRSEKPPFDDLFEQGLLAMCDRHATWEVGESRGDFEIEVYFGTLNYKGRAIVRPADEYQPPKTLGGVLIVELAEAVPTLPDGTELDPDGFLDVPLWYEEAAVFLQVRGWSEGPKPFILEDDQVSVWHPPHSLCSSCPRVLPCKTKNLN